MNPSILANASHDERPGKVITVKVYRIASLSAVVLAAATSCAAYALFYCDSSTSQIRGKKVRTAIRVLDVKLGKLKPLDQIKSSIKIENASNESVQLKPPLATCGCLLVNKDPVVVGPKASVDIDFELRVPGQCGNFTREVKLREVSDQQSEIIASISGDVVGDLWVGTDAIKLTDKAGIAAGQVAIFRRPGLDAPVVVPSQGLTIRHREEKGQSTIVEIERESLLSTRSNCGHVDIVTKEGGIVFQVPVICEVRDEIRTVPTALALGDLRSAKSPLVRKLMVMVSEPLTIGCLKAEALEEWVTASDIESSEGEGRGRVGKIELTFDVDQMDNRIDCEIVRIHDTSNKVECVIRAVGRKTPH